jgi:hypothetical protein
MWGKRNLHPEFLFDVTLVVRAYSNFHQLMDLFDQKSLDIHVLLLEVTKNDINFPFPIKQ